MSVQALPIISKGAIESGDFSEIWRAVEILRGAVLELDRAIAAQRRTTTLTEVPAPPSGQPDAIRLWVEDNGAGKTRLMVQFQSGAAVQLAIEP